MDEFIRYTCNVCGKALQSRREHAKKRVCCPCGNVMEVPEPVDEEQPTSALGTGSSTALTRTPPNQRPPQTAITEAVSESSENEMLARTTEELPPVAPPAYRLASPFQVAMAGLLGGPLAGFLLMHRNYAQCGKAAAGRAMIVAGLLLTAAAVAIGTFLPDLPSGSGACIVVSSWLVSGFTAKFKQGAMFQAHLDQDGAEASVWAILGFILLGIALSFLLSAALTIGLILVAGAH